MAGLLDGVLPALYSGADQIKRRVKGLLGDPREFLGQRSQDLQTMQDQDSALSYRRGLLSPQDPAYGRMAKNEPAFNARQAAEAEQRLMDIAMQGLTVWHGSPHKFDKFDSSKIGTGEGAQAYGHGLYFAENPAVALDYKTKLAPDKRATSLNDRMDNLMVGDKRAVDFGIEMNSDFIEAARQGQKQALEHIDSRLASWKQLAADPSYPFKDYAKEKVAAFTALQKEAKAKGVQYTGDGNLYKVDLPDSAIEKMLDWDAPLSKQPEAVRVAAMDLGLPKTATGKDIYNALATQARDMAIIRGQNAKTTLGGSQAAASADLSGFGIPGIRYLDGGSRGAGQGTRNFVVFDDQLPKILEVNGGLLGGRK